MTHCHRFSVCLSVCLCKNEIRYKTQPFTTVSEENSLFLVVFSVKFYLFWYFLIKSGKEIKQKILSQKWSKKGLKLQKLAKNQVFSRILFKKPNFFNFFQKLQLISLKNLKKIEIEKVLTQKNGQKWQNLSVFLRKTLKNYLLPNLAILYLPKFIDLCFLKKRTIKKV